MRNELLNQVHNHCDLGLRHVQSIMLAHIENTESLAIRLLSHSDFNIVLVFGDLNQFIKNV